ncbi:unnamed protein product [Triticum turgidum subsp. durum]|nr:unnamed protein product [Triticum turgidum subsp. durum]
MWKKYEQLNVGSEEKQRALREVKETVLHRKLLDSSIGFIGKLAFGFEGPSVLEATKGPGHPLVDYWDCLKTMVRDFESQCGSLTQYGMKHMRAFTNIYNMGKWSPPVLGHSA